jgi:hypothetical protein
VVLNTPPPVVVASEVTEAAERQGSAATDRAMVRRIMSTRPADHQGPADIARHVT